MEVTWPEESQATPVQSQGLKVDQPAGVGVRDLASLDMTVASSLDAMEVATVEAAEERWRREEVVRRRKRKEKLVGCVWWCSTIVVVVFVVGSLSLSH